MKWVRKAALFCATTLVLPLMLGGCLEIGKQKNPPGTLTGVTYQNTSGMAMRHHFFIRLSPEAVLHTSYWLKPEEEEWTYISKDDIPITAEQWSEVEELVLELYPSLEPEKGFLDLLLQPLRKLLDRWFYLQDGGDIFTFSLTWSTEDGTREISYKQPNSSKYTELRSLLEELAYSGE